MDRNQIDRNSKGARLRSRLDRQSKKSSRVRDGWSDRCDPQPQSPAASRQSVEFRRFARDVERDLNPRGPLERVVTEHATRAAWTLQQNPGGPPAAGATDRAQSSAARTLRISLETLDLLQGRRPAVDQPANEGDQARDRDESEDARLASNEWPILTGFADPDRSDSGVVEDGSTVEPPIWQGRLVFDFDVSATSPIVRGTWVTVSHIVSLIVDGATWADILRSHPELIEDDIRVCVAYAIAEDNSGL